MDLPLGGLSWLAGSSSTCASSGEPSTISPNLNSTPSAEPSIPSSKLSSLSSWTASSSMLIVEKQSPSLSLPSSLSSSSLASESLQVPIKCSSSFSSCKARWELILRSSCACTELILIVPLVPTHRANTCCDRASCERLVGAHRESSRERASSCHKIFLHVREAVVALLRKSKFLSRDLRFSACERRLLTPTHAEKVLIVRDVSVRTQRELSRELSSRDQAQSGPIPIGGRSELIFVRVVDRTHVRESVCVFLWRRDDDKWVIGEVA